MANLNNNKYLDLVGLAKFWERVKAVVQYCIIEIKTNHSKDSSNADIEWVKLSSTSVTQDPNDGGVKTTYTIDDTKINEKFISIDAAIATETSERKTADALLAGENWNSSSAIWSTTPTHSNITDISATLEDHASKIQSLVQATEFVGVVDWDPEAENLTITKGSANPIQLFEVKIGGTLKGTFRAGDIVVRDNTTKEYILDGDVNNGYKNPKFIELGDVTEEAERLTNIETWIATPITYSDLDKVFKNEVTDLNNPKYNY